MNPGEITVALRYRRDLGDVSELATSIAMHGLMHPIVVAEDGRLIAGQRRLEACKSLGWADIPVTVAGAVTDAAELLRMERDENTCRKDMTPSEQVALGTALEDLERPKADAAHRAGSARGGRGEGSVPPNEALRNKRFDTREVVAPAVGMSTATYSRAKQLIAAAEEGDEVAAEQVEEMDRTGKVTNPYETWKGHKVNRGPAARATRDPFGLADDAPAEAAPKPKAAPVKKYRGRKPIRAMEGAIATLSGLTDPMGTLNADDLADVDDEVRQRWVNELSTAITTLRRVRNLIKE